MIASWFDSLSGSGADLVAWVLMHFLWQGLAVGLLVVAFLESALPKKK